MSVVDNFIEVSLSNKEDFLKIKETLTRIGIASRKENVLYQSCHILHKQGKYYIVHFKEMFLLDGRESNFSDEDRARRNIITQRLEEWDLLTVLNKEMIDNKDRTAYIKIIPFKEKSSWELVAKYNVGKHRKNN